MIICLERGADLHMAQLMPLPLTVSCSSKIRLTWVVPDKGPLNGCVGVCVCVSLTNDRFVSACQHHSKISQLRTDITAFMNTKKRVVSTLPLASWRRFSRPTRSRCSTGTECDVALAARPQQPATSLYLAPVRPQQHTLITAGDLAIPGTCMTTTAHLDNSRRPHYTWHLYHINTSPHNVIPC